MKPKNNQRDLKGFELAKELSVSAKSCVGKSCSMKGKAGYVMTDSPSIKIRLSPSEAFPATREAYGSAIHVRRDNE